MTRPIIGILLTALGACGGVTPTHTGEASAPELASSPPPPLSSAAPIPAAPLSYETLSGEESLAIGRQLCDTIHIPNGVLPREAALYEGARRETCRYEWSDTVVSLARDAFPNCLRALAEDPPTLDTEILTVAECARAVRVATTVGQPCTRAFGCGPALFCHPVRGDCREATPLGAECTQDFACGADGVCRAGVCVARLAEGVRCHEPPGVEPSETRLADCQVGLVCIDEHCSRARGTLGQRCNDLYNFDRVCAPGLQCNGRTCEAAAKSGERCSMDGSCAHRACMHADPDRPGTCF